MKRDSAFFIFHLIHTNSKANFNIQHFYVTIILYSNWPNAKKRSHVLKTNKEFYSHMVLQHIFIFFTGIKQSIKVKKCLSCNLFCFRELNVQGSHLTFHTDYVITDLSDGCLSQRLG